MGHEWPPHPTGHVQWEVQTTRGPKLGESDVGIPDEIAELPVYPNSPSAREAVINAEQRLLRRDVPNGLGGTMKGLLLRTEAVSSSRPAGLKGYPQVSAISVWQRRGRHPDPAQRRQSATSHL